MLQQRAAETLDGTGEAETFNWQVEQEKQRLSLVKWNARREDLHLASGTGEAETFTWNRKTSEARKTARGGKGRHKVGMQDLVYGTGTVRRSLAAGNFESQAEAKHQGYNVWRHTTKLGQTQLTQLSRKQKRKKAWPGTQGLSTSGDTAFPPPW
jgi:hypothetical protein